MSSNYIINMVPVINDKPVKDFEKKIGGLGSKLGSAMSKTAKYGAMVGATSGMTLLGLAFNSTTNKIEKMNTALEDSLSYFDRLSTLAPDLGITAGEVGYVSASLKSYGLDESSQDKVFASVQKSIAEGTLVNDKSLAIPSIIAELQKQWQEANTRGDQATKSLIEAQIGLRGKQASELLQSSLLDTMKLIEKNTGISSERLAEVANKAGETERMQAESIATSEIKYNTAVYEAMQKADAQGKTPMVQSLEQFNIEMKTMELEVFGNYESILKVEKLKKITLFKATTLLDNFINWVNNSIGSKEGIMGSFVALLFDGLDKQIGKVKNFFYEALSGILPSYLIKKPSSKSKEDSTKENTTNSINNNMEKTNNQKWNDSRFKR